MQGAEIVVASFLLVPRAMKKPKRGLVLKTETIQLLASDLRRVSGGYAAKDLMAQNPSTDPACTHP